MPNWCTTHYTVCGERDSLDKIEAAIKKVRTDKNNSDYQPWLYDTLLQMGVPEEKMNRNIRNYRGYIYYDDRPSEDCLLVYCETAWSEADGFRHTLLEALPDIEVSYTAVECGNCVFVTNDDGVAGQFYVEDGDENGFYDEGEVIEHFRKIFNDADISTMEQGWH